MNFPAIVLALIFVPLTVLGVITVYLIVAKTEASGELWPPEICVCSHLMKLPAVESE